MLFLQIYVETFSKSRWKHSFALAAMPKGSDDFLQGDECQLGADAARKTHAAENAVATWCPIIVSMQLLGKTMKSHRGMIRR